MTEIRDDRRLTVIVAEYTALRGEIHQRINNQLLLLGFSAALVAGMVPLVARMSGPNQVQFFLVIPAVFMLIACMYYEQHLMVVELSGYIWTVLRPHAISLTAAHGHLAPFDWERFRRQQTSRAWVYGAHVVRIIATAGVAVVSLGIGLYLRATTSPLVPLHWYLLAGFVVQLLLTVAFGHVLLQLYRVDKRIAA